MENTTVQINANILFVCPGNRLNILDPDLILEKSELPIRLS
jgi:hypothetical protein